MVWSSGHVVHRMMPPYLERKYLPSPPPNLPSTSFSCKRVNSTTFLIIEDDSFGEQPHIYVKVYPEVIVISDTGCNSPRLSTLKVTFLRQYIEQYPILSNNKRHPLNPGGKKPYVIIFSHCHYDHILGIEQFEGPNTTIIASGNSKSFIEKDLDIHSLCKYVDTPTPLYKINHWARNLEYFSWNDKSTNRDVPLRIQFFQVPGHTPDSLSWYDIDEHHLYVGDTFYSRKPSYLVPPGSKGAPIIFPSEGDLATYLSSLALLSDFVVRQNQIFRQDHHKFTVDSTVATRVLVSSGHLTVAEDAEKMLFDVTSFFMRIIGNSIPVVESIVKRGEIFDLWEDPDRDNFSVMAPRRLVEEARRRIGMS